MTLSPWGRSLIVFAGLFTTPTLAGEIAGLPSQAPPFLQRDVEINLSNDFLGRGGSTDDFRTQQIILAARFGDDWLGVLDHSILTLGSGNAPGRVDQLSGSLGYKLIGSYDQDRVTTLVFGGGFRGSGNYSGARMQNGFHRLIGSDVETMPYVAADRTDLTAWLDGEIYRTLDVFGADGTAGGWRPGYWLRGSALVTSDGQLDSALGAYAVASRNAIDLWFGVRRDWRSGYDNDRVQAATAAAESELGIVLGARFGAILVETVQQPNGKTSYGQIKFVSSGKRPYPGSASWPRASIDFGFLLPDVQVQLAGRIRCHFFLDADSPWRQSILVETRFGEPQYEDNTAIFIGSSQISVGLEMERQLSQAIPWISYYGSLAGGIRYEQLLGDNRLAGEESASVGRAVISAGAGLRFNAAALGQSWHYRLQIGLAGWLPLSDADVEFAGASYRVQKPALSLLLGMTFEYQ